MVTVITTSYIDYAICVGLQVYRQCYQAYGSSGISNSARLYIIQPWKLKHIPSFFYVSCSWEIEIYLKFPPRVYLHVFSHLQICYCFHIAMHKGFELNVFKFPLESLLKVTLREEFEINLVWYSINLNLPYHNLKGLWKSSSRRQIYFDINTKMCFISVYIFCVHASCTLCGCFFIIIVIVFTLLCRLTKRRSYSSKNYC